MSQSIDRSIIIPVYRNEENIPDLLPVLEQLTESLDGVTEVVFVVDGSPDRSGDALRAGLESCAFPARLLFHSRNFGSFAAIRTGLVHARGEHFAAMAADLQEPPELILDFFRTLERDEADVVFGHRAERNDSRSSMFLSNLFWGFYRRFVVPDVPSGGVDIFACNRKVRDALLSIEESNSSLVAQLFWVGFRRKFASYSRRAREKGKSAWSFKRRFNYMLDSIFSYSDLPVMVLLWTGILGIVFSLLLSLLILTAKMLGFIEVAGYTPVMLTILIMGSITLFSQGLMGCYLWRTLENTKHRPLSLICDECVFPGRETSQGDD
ncbi:glycosyltransferase family 2 protein [Thiocapsa marina]|uniref:Glycosyl transferase family 2 n=1 Tax=Thiocapsa marina 5811 TaxID=768671 RepID=F9U9G5_9GAMM|nr:glycosyltransferase family 2 protein [Thiocapsa marina]EGV19423.1 glycosyl transferase family 2 [Thiocapsa marina 5811]